jgi:hypothetical protein
MDSLKYNELAHQASIDQQREVLRYVTNLHEWLQSNVQELQFELINLSDSVKQLRREALLQKSSVQCTPQRSPAFPPSMAPAPGGIYIPTPEPLSSRLPQMPPGFVPTGFMPSPNGPTAIPPGFMQTAIPACVSYASPYTMPGVVPSPMTMCYDVPQGWPFALPPQVNPSNPPVLQPPPLPLPMTVPPPSSIYESPYIPCMPSPTPPVVLVEPPTRPPSHTTDSSVPYGGPAFLPTHLSRITEEMTIELPAPTPSVASSRYSPSSTTYEHEEDDRGRSRTRTPAAYEPPISPRSSIRSTPSVRMPRTRTPVPRRWSTSSEDRDRRTHSDTQRSTHRSERRRSRTPIRVSVNPTIIVCNAGAAGCTHAAASTTLSHTGTPTRSQVDISLPALVGDFRRPVEQARSVPGERSPRVAVRNTEPSSLPPVTRVDCFSTSPTTNQSARYSLYSPSVTPSPRLARMDPMERSVSPPQIRITPMSPSPPLPIRTISPPATTFGSANGSLYDYDPYWHQSLLTPPPMRSTPLVHASQFADAFAAPSQASSMPFGGRSHDVRPSFAASPVTTNAAYVPPSPRPGLSHESLLSRLLGRSSYPSSPSSSPYAAPVRPAPSTTAHMTGAPPGPASLAPAVPQSVIVSPLLLSPTSECSTVDVWVRGGRERRHPDPPSRSLSTTPPNVVRVSPNQYPAATPPDMATAAPALTGWNGYIVHQPTMTASSARRGPRPVLTRTYCGFEEPLRPNRRIPVPALLERDLGIPSPDRRTIWLD